MKNEAEVIFDNAEKDDLNKLQAQRILSLIEDLVQTKALFYASYMMDAVSTSGMKE